MFKNIVLSKSGCFLSHTEYIYFSVLTWRTLSLADLIRCVIALLWCSRNELNSSLQVKDDRSPILIKVWQSTVRRMWKTLIRKASDKVSPWALWAVTANSLAQFGTKSATSMGNPSTQGPPACNWHLKWGQSCGLSPSTAGADSNFRETVSEVNCKTPS